MKAIFCRLLRCCRIKHSAVWAVHPVTVQHDWHPCCTLHSSASFLLGMNLFICLLALFISHYIFHVQLTYTESKAYHFCPLLNPQRLMDLSFASPTFSFFCYGQAVSDSTVKLTTYRHTRTHSREHLFLFPWGLFFLFAKKCKQKKKQDFLLKVHLFFNMKTLTGLVWIPHAVVSEVLLATDGATSWCSSRKL